MNPQQNAVMHFDPTDSGKPANPSHAEQWRAAYGKKAWLYNPWTGEHRSAEDIGSDPFGYLIKAPEFKPAILVSDDAHLSAEVERLRAEIDQLIQTLVATSESAEITIKVLKKRLMKAETVIMGTQNSYESRQTQYVSDTHLVEHLYKRSCEYFESIVPDDLSVSLDKSQVASAA